MSMGLGKEGYMEFSRSQKGSSLHRGRIPRQWVFIMDDGEAFLHLKVTRSKIQGIESIAEAHGWDFSEAVRQVLLAGLAVHGETRKESPQHRTC